MKKKPIDYSETFTVSIPKEDLECLRPKTIIHHGDGRREVIYWKPIRKFV